VRLNGCPWRALSDPFVIAVTRSHRWFEKGELALKWGDDPPAALMAGIEVYAGALNAVQAHDDQKRAERREQERKEREAQRAPDGPRGSRGRHPRRR
jgi:hypothetical protein